MCATLRKSYGTSYSKVTVRRTPTRYGTSRKRYGMSHYGTSHSVDYGTSYGRRLAREINVALHGFLADTVTDTWSRTPQHEAKVVNTHFV